MTSQTFKIMIDSFDTHVHFRVFSNRAFSGRLCMTPAEFAEFLALLSQRPFPPRELARVVIEVADIPEHIREILWREVLLPESGKPMTTRSTFERGATEVCGNCASFDRETKICERIHQTVEADGWCEGFAIHPNLTGKVERIEDVPESPEQGAS